MSTETLAQSKPVAAAPVISPVKLAHFVLRTSRYDELVNWYKTVFGAHAAFENEMLTFLTYDEEHHRFAILRMPGLGEQPAGIAGVHHVAFTYASLGDLMSQYERLRDLAITPVFVVNHGPTTSLYYADPDGNQLEFQVENYDTIEESTAFFYSQDFAENPIGVEFDPEDLLKRLKAGEDEAKLKMRPKGPIPNLADVKLR